MGAKAGASAGCAGRSLPAASKADECTSHSGGDRWLTVLWAEKLECREEGSAGPQLSGVSSARSGRCAGRAAGTLSEGLGEGSCMRGRSRRLRWLALGPALRVLLQLTCKSLL